MDCKSGAFQVYLRSKVPESPFLEAREHIKALESKALFTEEEKLLFQKSAIFDFLIGNLDRHEDNWFVRVIPSGEFIRDFRLASHR